MLRDSYGGPCEVGDVTQGIRSTKGHDLDRVIPDRGSPRDLEVTAVILDTTRQNEATGQCATSDLNRVRGHSKENLLDTRQNIGTLPQAALDTGVDARHNAGIQADTQHAREKYNCKNSSYNGGDVRI